MTTARTYPTPDQAEIFHTTDQLVRAVTDSGSHFFDKETMRFFASRLAPGIIGGRFFITSEKRGFDDYTREYRVRYVLRHEEAGGFLGVEDVFPPDADPTTEDSPRYPTLGQARTAARRADRAL